MSLSSAEINDLYRRARLAVVRGYTIARAEFYARELGSKDESPGALFAACHTALVKHAPRADAAPEVEKARPVTVGRAEISAPKPAPAPESPAPKAPEAPPVPTVEEASSEDDTSEAYESWSKKKLLAAAMERGLDVTAHNTKAEIISALRS